MPGITVIRVPYSPPGALVARADSGTVLDNGKRGRARAVRPCTQMVHHVLGRRKLHLSGIGPFAVADEPTSVEVTVPREPYSFDLLVTIIASTSSTGDEGTIEVTTSLGSETIDFVGTATDEIDDAHTYVVQVSWGAGVPADMGDETIEIEFALDDGERLLVWGITFEALGSETLEIS